MVIAIASLLIVGFNVFWIFKVGIPYTKLLLEKTPRRVFRVTPMPQSDRITPEDTQTTPERTEAVEESGTTSEPTEEAPSMTERLDPLPSVEDANDLPISTEDTEQDAPPSNNGDDIDAEEAARIEALLEEARNALQRGNELMEWAIPLAVAELNGLSVEEQRKTLKEAKDVMFDTIPVEVEQVVKEDLVEEAWTRYLEMLAEAGYVPPEGID